MLDAIDIEELGLSDVLVLAKRTEQAVKLQLGALLSRSGKCGSEQSEDKLSKKPHYMKQNKSQRPLGTISCEQLTSREKGFLKNNIKCGGGLVVNENVQNKVEWIEWMRRENLCIKCAGKGHRIAECTVGSSKPSDK
jgi:hypothetical protein